MRSGRSDHPGRYEAIEMMAEKEVGALTVLEDETRRLIGIISERDYARKVILKNRSSRETTVAEIMTKDVVTVEESTPVDKCMTLMVSNKIRHLPVIKGHILVGIVAGVDVFKFIIREQSSLIEQLENYVKDETGGSG